MLHYIDQGEGLTILLLHGFCENASLWSGITERLTDNFRIIAPDLPGHGESDLLPELESLNDVASIIRNLLDTLDLKRVKIVGHSLGGYVGLSMLEMYPDYVEGLGLFHSTARADSTVKQANRNKTLEFIRRNGDMPFKQTFIPSLFHRSYLWEEDLAQMVMATPVETINMYTRMMRDRPDRLEMWRNADISSLIIAGKYDEFISLADLQEQAAALPSCDFHVLNQSGHLGMWEEPERSVNILTDFLAGN